MTNYEISLSKEADQDFVSYVNFIKYECKSPLTALRHYEGLYKTLQQLRISPEAHQIQTRSYFMKFGISVRKVSYKKMAIIYTAHENIVYVHRIIASAMITE